MFDLSLLPLRRLLIDELEELLNLDDIIIIIATKDQRSILIIPSMWDRAQCREWRWSILSTMDMEVMLDTLTRLQKKN